MKTIVWGLGAFLMYSCSQTIELDLPEYEPRLTVEFYLEDGRPLVCLLQESLNYTDERLFNAVSDALVILKYGEQADTLANTLLFDTVFDKAYNYSSTKIFRAESNLEYELYIQDRQGRELHARTRYSPPVRIDSVAYDFNQQGEARVGMVFFDPGDTANYYRIVAVPADTTITADETWDISLADDSFNGTRFSFFTGFTYKTGREVLARLYSLDEAHYDYTESVSTARQSNFNPFGQPAPLRGNVEGGIGIFTVLRYEEVLVPIRE